jgi:hypothetical protein
MIRHFATVRAHGLFPLEAACGTLSCRPERIPSMAAFAAPGDIVRGLEVAFGTANETAIGTAHRRAERLLARCSDSAARRDDPGIRPPRAGRVRVLHAGDG